MIEVDSAWVRSYLEGARDRINRSADVLEWAAGAQELTQAHLIPDFPRDQQASNVAQKDWERYKRQVQSLGPRILKTKRAGAVGDVNWGGESDNLDARLEALDLRALARAAFDDLACNGIAAAWAYRDEDTGASRVQVLGGYKEPIYREDDPAGEVIGLYQVVHEPGSAKVRYRVRVYDFEAKSIREWRDLDDPTKLGRGPDGFWENTSVPRVVMFDTDQAGYPLGEVAQALELLRSEVALQLRILRVADAHAYPLLWMAGPWDEVREVGAQKVMTSSDPSAQVGRVEPGDMQQLFTLQDRAMERIRADQSLPIGSITTGSWPSGEALTQANVAFITSSQDYAHLESRLLTGVVADYAELEGIAEAPPVTVGINREQMRSVIAHQVREDYKAGVVSRRMAVVALAPYYPATSSEEIEEFLTGETPAAEEAPA